MSKADRRIDSAICLPLSGLDRKLLGGRASLPAILTAGTEARAPESKGAHSSVGQSYRLITGWSLVRVQVGPPQLPHSRFNRLNSIGVEKTR
jgi:hypothetical protein